MISSESQFVWRQILFILKLPFILILVFLGKRQPALLLGPMRELWYFIINARATAVLIALNLIMFLVELIFLGADGVMRYAFTPQDLFSFNLVPIVVSWFLHASLLHLAGNMLFLFIFGRIVERELGPFRMALVYFGSAIVSDIASALFGQGGIGASGAIAGLVSASILLKPFYFTYLVGGIPLPVIVVGWLAIIADISGILVPSGDNIGHIAHLGGYAAVAVLLFLFSTKERKKLTIGLLINLAFVAIMLYLSRLFGFSLW